MPDMRILYSICIVAILSTSRIFAEGEEECPDGECHGDQKMTHDDSLEATVLKPENGHGSNDAINHFRQMFEETEEETEEESEIENGEDGEKMTRTVEIRHVEEVEEQEFESRPIDPDNPEELSKHKQLRTTDTFSQILSENKGIRMSGIVEGDMRFNTFRNAAGDTWPKTRFGSLAGMVPIPYKINKYYNDTERAIIKSAMSLYHEHTCIRFVPRKSEISYIYITDAKGCWAYVGKTGYSAQTVSLGRPGCLAKGIAAHELMHVVGFQHEHSRSDRDKYVTILEHNIQSKMRQNFEVHKNTRNLVIYDYNSVMHYSKNAFSKFQYLPAIQITPKRKPEPDIGQRERMSPYDIEEVKYLYNCADKTYKRCGQDFQGARSGTFTSPNFPKPYPTEAHCTWKITVPKNSYVSLVITNLDIEDSKLCQKDAILVHDGKDAAAPRLGAVCGTDKKKTTIVSTGNTMFVMFTSDPNRTGKHTGFRATFRMTSRKGKLPVQPTVPTLPQISSGSSSFSCDFESDICQMTQDKLDQIDWIRYKGSTPSQDTGPSGDYNSGKGYYMYVESSLPSKLGDNAIIRTPWLKRSQLTVEFAYHMLGQYMGTMRLYAFEKRKLSPYGHEVLLWERHGNYGDKWHVQSYDYKPTPDVQFVQFYWEAFVFFYQSDFGLDDIKISKTKPCTAATKKGGRSAGTACVASTNAPAPALQSSAAPQTTKPAVTTATIAATAAPTSTDPVAETSCDFENGLCGWEQDKLDDFDWIRTNKPTPSQNTGPQTDHTTSSGYFLFIEASSPRVLNDAARLVSPKLTKGPHCLKVWYHMNGAQMGSLLVKLISGKTVTTLVEKSGNKGDSWLLLQQEIVIPSMKTVGARLSSDDFVQVVIEAVRGTGYPGDLAIDDIEVTGSACDSANVVTTPSTYARSAHCDFDNAELCGFYNTDIDDFDWTKNSGKTQSGSTGPTVDHSLGDSSGSYMYIEASSPRKAGHKATLVSPKLASGKYCVQFYVHMWGSGMGSITVYTNEYSGDDSPIRKLRWELEGTQGDFWSSGSFEFETALSMKYVDLHFVGEIGGTFTSDAAIDDITIEPGSCDGNDVSTTASPPVTTKQTKRPTTRATTTTTEKIRPKITRPTPLMRRPVRTTRQPTTNRWLQWRKTATTTKQTTTTTTRRPRTTTTTTRRPRTTTTTTKRPTTTTTTTTTRPTTTTTTTRKPRTTTTTPKRTTTTRRPTATTTTTTRKPRTTTTTTTKRTTTTTRRPTTTTTTTRRPRTTTTTTKRPRTTTTTTTTRRPRTTTTTTRRPRTKPITKFTTTKAAPKLLPAGRTIITRPPPKATPRPKNVKTTTTTVPDDKMQDFKCDFDSEKFCGMTQHNGDNFDWLRNSGNTASSGTGPISDHTRTTKFGFYIYAEGSKPRVLGDNTIIATPPMSARPRRRCVTFWYHMHGKDIGALRVWSEIDDNGILKKFAAASQKQIEFTRKDPQGNSWRRASFDLTKFSTKSTATLRVHFEAIIGKGFSSDIAVDDICITTDPCNVRSSCDGQGTIAPTTVRSRKNISPSVKFPATKKIQRIPVTLPKDVTPVLQGMRSMMELCTFDSNVKKQSSAAASSDDVLCGWEQEGVRDDFDWDRNRGPTTSSYTGPSSDHTSGNGQYMFIESSAPRVPKQQAILRSPELFPTFFCVDFYYNMYGAGIGQLYVRAQQVTRHQPFRLSTLKTIRGNQGKGWKHMSVDFRPVFNSKSVRFRLDGEVGKDYTGDIAIDDLRVTPGKCGSCGIPNKRVRDGSGQEKTFSTGCIHSKLFFVKCCNLPEMKIEFVNVPRCSPHALPLDRLHKLCYGV